MKKMFFISVLCGLFIGCEKSFDKFSLQRQIYTGNELRIDGYYYIEQQSDGINKIRDISCFYRNGILLSMGGDASSLEEADEYIRREFENGSIVYARYGALLWGLFVIDNEAIKFERYYNTDDIRVRAYISEGAILNDTTFRITTSYRSDGKERRDKDELYHFRQFSPKPDSTVVYKWIK